ncbi:hypothetical protein SKAU_G00158970 [Synaphobranchus kaupii]|uniref:MULE transposase domain-containing protein n=1 Tax=Synaphobranchus kaupii TaxID=118154 RepID=A0A9Q1IZP3_SYNKA|nr:hypothetical protein SKAU_G00158970 [Synaphobranchus kaupii]
MAEYLEGFIREMTIYPNMVTVAALPEMVEEFKKLLLLLPQSHPPQMLYYDTTFNMGDFYISTLLFSHGAFQERPTTPLAVMAHQTKDQKSHEAFFLQILHMLPELTSKRIVICTDREAAIENAIEKVLPTVPIVNCWNHLMQNVKHTMRGCGGTKEDVEVYQAHLNQLLSCISLTQYHTVKQDISSMCLRGKRRSGLKGPTEEQLKVVVPAPDSKLGVQNQNILNDPETSKKKFQNEVHAIATNTACSMKQGKVKQSC